MAEQQPEALRLADALRDGTYLLSVERAATEAELRRLAAVEAERNALVGETQRLSAALSSVNRRSDYLGIRLGEVIAERNALQTKADRAEQCAAYEAQRADKAEAERDALREALTVAWRVIQHDREALVECSTTPSGAIDFDAIEHVDYYDAALAQIDAAMGGSNG